MLMARGFPCMVPSYDNIVLPSMNSSVLLLYVLINTVASDGQRIWMFLSVACLLSLLNALVAFTCSIASVHSL